MLNQNLVYQTTPLNESSSGTQKQKELKKLDKLAKETNKVIYEISSVWPFQLFPDRLIIDESKITVVRRGLFFKRVLPITFDKIGTIKVNRSFMFASMEFDANLFTHAPSPLTHLYPKEANKAKKYIIGLMQAVNSGVDLSKLSIDEVREKLEKIGNIEDETAYLF